jgi:hypothetical protein
VNRPPPVSNILEERQIPRWFDKGWRRSLSFADHVNQSLIDIKFPESLEKQLEQRPSGVIANPNP